MFFGPLKVSKKGDGGDDCDDGAMVKGKAGLAPGCRRSFNRSRSYRYAKTLTTKSFLDKMKMAMKMTACSIISFSMPIFLQGKREKLNILGCVSMQRISMGS